MPVPTDNTDQGKARGDHPRHAASISVVSPGDRRPLTWADDKLCRTEDGREFPVVEGIPILLDEERLGEAHKSVMEYYANEAVVYNRSHGGDLYGTEYNIRRYYQRLFDKYILRGGRVLEFGAGTGRFSRIFKEIAGELYLTDLSIEMLLNNPEISCLRVCADTEQIPFPDSSFDCCVGVTTFSYVPDKKAAVGELHRVLKPGGVLLIIDQHQRSFIKSIAALIYLKHREKNRVAPIRDSHLPYLTALFADNGFTIEERGIVSFIPHAFGRVLTTVFTPVDFILSHTPYVKNKGMRLYIAGRCEK